MKRIWILITSLIFSSFVFASGTQFYIERVGLHDAVVMIYNDVLHRPFMIAPELVNDPRVLSLSINAESDEREFMIRYLSAMNISVKEKDGVDYIFTTPPEKKTQNI